MSVKVLLIFACAAIGTAIGYGVRYTYRRNFAYFDDVCKMLGALKRNIAYKKDSAALVLGEIATNNSQFQKNIREYIEFAGSKAEKPVISRGFLSQDAYRTVCDMFASIGRSDGATQVQQLEMFCDSFDKFRSGAEEKLNKLGGVAVKLGFLFGLGLGILTL